MIKCQKGWAKFWIPVFTGMTGE